MNSGLILVFLLVAALMVALAIFAAIQAKRRREAMAQLAARLGLQFAPDRDHGLADRYRFLNRLARGSNRYAYNVLSGRYRDQEVLAFDYHYETHSTNSKGQRQTHHHYFSFFILLLPRAFPELVIVREDIFSKIAQAVGYDDIDFESAEFSRRFCVRSPDKKFAYDVCHPRFMEYFLANPDLSLEIEGPALALAFPSRLSVEQIERNLGRLTEVRALLPDYLLRQP